ncbi:zf-HC2 domain-containing protein [Halobacillus sp. GSS1]|uniref:zf-HC2 domain-containing protein n=1 Tax=Halobacillus sp. GSS1 TaxID=2815919 RepID=UPI001A9028BC|nr:zf-HC2 domain-containing protein [Halobacillus sp. GSS1]MBN9654154.1 zf-HC2 domain-containing protein [Halobacillus sp. GSS1]
MNEELCQEIVHYLRNQLDEKERITFKKHLNHCATCSEEIKVLQGKGEADESREKGAPPSGMKKRVFHSIHNGQGL